MELPSDAEKKSIRDLQSAGWHQIADSRFFIENPRDANSPMYYINNDGSIAKVRKGPKIRTNHPDGECGTSMDPVYYPSIDAVFIEHRGLIARGGPIITTVKKEDVFRQMKPAIKNGDKPLFLASTMNTSRYGAKKSLILVRHANDNEYNYGFIFKDEDNIHISDSKRYAIAEDYIKTPVWHHTLRAFDMQSKTFFDALGVMRGTSVRYAARNEPDGCVITDFDFIPIYKLNKQARAFSSIYSKGESFYKANSVLTVDNKYGVVDIEKLEVLMPAVYDYTSSHEAWGHLVVGVLDGDDLRYGLWDLANKREVVKPEYDQYATMYYSNEADKQFWFIKGKDIFRYDASYEGKHEGAFYKISFPEREVPEKILNAFRKKLDDQAAILPEN